VFVSGKPFKPSLIFVGKARNYPTIKRHSTRVGSGLTHKYKARLKRIVKYKHPNLFCTFVSDEEKCFFNNIDCCERNGNVFVHQKK
jgi:hypothetical protein